MSAWVRGNDTGMFDIHLHVLFFRRFYFLLLSIFVLDGPRTSTLSTCCVVRCLIPWSRCSPTRQLPTLFLWDFYARSPVAVHIKPVSKRIGARFTCDANLRWRFCHKSLNGWNWYFVFTYNHFSDFLECQVWKVWLWSFQENYWGRSWVFRILIKNLLLLIIYSGKRVQTNEV